MMQDTASIHPGHKWVPANLMLGITLQLLASHPGGSTNTPSQFMLQKLKAGDRDAHKKEGRLACEKAGGVHHLASSSLYKISLFIPEQPRSQGLSSYRLGQARRDPGLVWSHATVTIENIREGSSVIRQFVALSFVALSRHYHHKRCLKVVFGLKFRTVSNYSNVYLKVRQVFLETINCGRDAVVVVPVGFMDNYELWTSSRSPAEQFYSKVIVIVVSPLTARDQVDPKKT